LTIAQLRRARRLAYLNGSLWAGGNALASTTLVVYLAKEFGAAGLAVGVILAAPKLIGVLRMGEPVLAGWIGDRKRLCIGGFLASSVVLGGMLLLCGSGILPSARYSLVALIVLWSLYHLLEYLATVALWAWQADLVPRRIRGRFIGRRERWMMLATLAGAAASGLGTLGWKSSLAPSPRQIWIGYAISAAVGAIVLAAAVVPLAMMPASRFAASTAASTAASVRRWSELLAPLRDRRYLSLLAFGVWFSFFNGLTQSAQYVYSIDRFALNLDLLWLLLLASIMRLGQSLAAPQVGRLVDRLGNRPVLVASQLIVSTGLLFYWMATPADPWPIAGAWIVWIAYVGLNVGLVNLMLKLSPAEASAYIAAYFGLTGLVYGFSTVVGGWLFDAAGRYDGFVLGRWTFSRYDLFFLGGTLGRAAGVFWLLRLVEPGARRWRQIVADWQRNNDELNRRS